MKKIDERILNIVIPETENSAEISFNIAQSKLEKALKDAEMMKYDTVVFYVGNQIVKLPKEQIEHLVELGQKTFGVELEIPKMLQRYLTNLSLSAYVKGKEKLSARDEEIEKIWSCLSLNQKNNCILVGDHGVGKTTIAFEVTRRIKHKQCPENLAICNVLRLNTLEMIQLADRPAFMYKIILNQLLDFVISNKRNIIIYIDNLFHVKCDLMLLKAFSLFVKTHHIKVISSISPEHFEDYFEMDYDLMRYVNPILVEEPEVKDIYPMLKSRINNMQKRYGVKISEKMIKFAILTGLHLSSSNSANPESTLDVIEFALADASRKQEKEVTKSNILAYYLIDFKLAKKTSEKEKYATAYHETGHYLVFEMSQHIKVEKNAFVSILPIQGALGITANYYDFGEQLTFSKDYFIDEIAYLLGGRVGEAIYTNEYSSGAQQDLVSANSMAEKLVLAYGLSDLEGEKNKSYMIGNYIKDFLLTDELRLQINDEISSIIKEAYSRAEKILNENKELLDEIVERLLEDGILMSDELEEICNKYKKNVIS